MDHKKMEGYKPPFVAGVQQGELLLPNGPFLQEKQHSIAQRGNVAATIVKPIAKKWPPDSRVKPVIPTQRAFAPIKHESIESIRNRYMI